MAEQDRHLWAKRAIHAMNAALPAVEHRNWPQWEQILAHTLVCAKLSEHYGFHFSEFANLLQQTGCNLAELYRAQGHYAQAESLYQRALAISEQQLGPQHPDTATSLNNLAALYRAQSKYSQAEPLLLRALTICKHTQGPQHPTTQTIRANYARLLRRMGHDDQATKGPS